MGGISLQKELINREKCPGKQDLRILLTNTEHKYDHVALRVLPAWCTLINGHHMHMQAIEGTANESNKPNENN